jgi:hypothetical protein
VKSRSFGSSVGHLLAAISAAGISAVAVFECTQSIVLRVAGIMVSIATYRAMLTLVVPPTHSTLNRLATAAVGLPICWPVFDLFRYWLGLDAFWVPSRLKTLGAWRIVWVFFGVWYLPIMIVIGASLFARTRRQVLPR